MLRSSAAPHALFALIGLIGSSAQASISITSVTLSGPSTIPCGSTATYEVQIAGTGMDSPILLHWHVLDVDVFSDDTLQTVTSETSENIDPNGWRLVRTFQLHCTPSPDCELRGRDGGSGENSAEVMVQVSTFLGFPATNGKSNVLSVTCVPAPGSLALLAFAGATGISRRRR